MGYELYYWPMIPGRGEPVRLTFAFGAIPYRDVAREEGIAVLQAFDAGEREEGHPFAPPYLVIEEDGDRTLHWQSAHLCDRIARREGLVDESNASRAMSLVLTLADLMDEAHDSPPPLATSLYYEDQKEAAQVAAEQFRTARIPKFLGFFEAHASEEGTLLGQNTSHVDAILWHVLEGLHYAFPKAMAGYAGRWPKVERLHERTPGHPSLAAYLASEDRIAFNEDGVFRRYPELDG